MKTAAAAPPYDCHEDACYNATEHNDPCPPGICRRDKDKKPAKDHPRPKCDIHGQAARPWGVEPTAVPAAPPKPEQRQE